MENIEENINFHGEEIKITDVSMIDQKMQMTVVTDENVMLDGLSINEDGKVLTGESVEERHASQGNLKRIYQFNIDEIPNEVRVEGMYYLKDYNVDIDIPVK